jgi:NADH-quinone oxidoreductase subunit J
MEPVYEQFFVLQYHGISSFLEAYNLPVGLRKWYLSKLKEQFDLEAVEEPARHIAGYSNITELASDLYTTYVYPFELAAVLLLIAIIAAITLVHRKESRSKRQNISEQVSVQASDRVRLASISSTKTKEPK